MYNLPTTLICTVGTSLFFPNLSRLDPEKQYLQEPSDSDSIGLAEKNALLRYKLWSNREKLSEILNNIKNAFDKKDFSRLADQLVLLPPELRLCGAEINSIGAMFRKKFISENRDRLIFLVSDTDEGTYIGKILTAYFGHRKCEIGFSQCDYITVPGLQDEKPLVFQRDGLTNLVRLLGEQLRKWGNESIAINATGGYKAQIALAVAFSQATKCQVFYKHERFDQIIRFPRIPFTIDLSLVENDLKRWATLTEPGAVFSEFKIKNLLPDDPELNEAIYPLLDCEEIDNESYYSLSALGQVYWEAFYSQHSDVTIEPPNVKKRRGCHFSGDHHRQIGFENYVKNVYNSFPKLISECHALPYDRQKAFTRNRFYIIKGQIIGDYIDRNNFGGRFKVMTEAQNELERKCVVKHLNELIERK